MIILSHQQLLQNYNMNTKDINDYIRLLSSKDSKSLSQKALKTTEEVGELAKAILPFESAQGTNHRFSDKESILEEVIDVYLSSISIAYSLGFSDDDINAMIIKKASKWSELQSRESEVTYPLPYEIHVSIDASDINIDDFKSICSEIGVKPIVLDLEINSGSPIKDVMTSSKHIGDNRSAYDECIRISEFLSESGLKVLRKKIETVPWHPAAPKTGNGHLANNWYFESHIGVTILPHQKQKLNILSTFFNNSYILGNSPEFQTINRLKGFNPISLSGTTNLSQNFFKKSNDGSKYVNMLTYRCHKGNYPNFQKEVEDIKLYLKSNGFEFEKVEIEFAIYDSNVNHDLAWINNGQVNESV